MHATVKQIMKLTQTKTIVQKQSHKAKDVLMEANASMMVRRFGVNVRLHTFLEKDARRTKVS